MLFRSSMSEICAYAYHGQADYEGSDYSDIPVSYTHLLEKTTSIRAEMDDIFKQCGVHPNIICTCPNMDSLISMIRADMGVTFLSSGVAKAYKTPDLCCIPIRPAYRTKTAMITRETATPSEPLQYFEEMCIRDRSRRRSRKSER